MKTALLLLCVGVVVVIPLRVRAAQTSQRRPAVVGMSEGLRLGGGGVPPGYMILGESPEAPPGYTYSGFSVLTEPGGEPGEPTWSYVPPMQVARGELAAAAVKGKVYAIGGYNGGYLSSVEEFAPGASSWTLRAPMPTARAEIEAAVVGDAVYVFGGFNGSYLGVVEVYDAETNAWSARAPMPTPRDRLTTAVVAGRILVIGGYNGSALAVVEEYDPATNTWATKPPMPGVNSEAAAAMLNGLVYVIGGDNGFAQHQLIMIYDPATESWSTRSGLSIYDNAVAVLDGVLYSFGGVSGSGTYEFNEDVTSWTEIQPMPTHRATLAAAVTGDRVYLLGGFVGPFLNAPTATVEAFGMTRRLYAHRKTD